MRKKTGRLDDERKKGHNEMDIYSSRCFGGCLFVVGMRMNSGENGTRGEKIEEREVGGGGREEGEGFGGQTNKQTTHRFPAALCHSRETPFASHHPAALISTYVKDTPQTGGGAGWLIASSGRLSGTGRPR